MFKQSNLFMCTPQPWG